MRDFGVVGMRRRFSCFPDFRGFARCIPLAIYFAADFRRQKEAMGRPTRIWIAITEAVYAAISGLPAALAVSPEIMVATIPPAMGAMALRAYSLPKISCPRVKPSTTIPATPARDTRMVLHSFFSSFSSRVEPRLVKISVIPKVGMMEDNPERSTIFPGKSFSTLPNRINAVMAVIKVEMMPFVFRAI